MSFGDKLKEAREKKKLSQHQLAAILGCTDGTISNYEHGIAFPRWESVSGICSVLEVDPNYLFWDSLTEKIKEMVLEQTNLSRYNKLNAFGQKKVDEYIEDLLGNYIYAKALPHNDILFSAARKKSSPPEIEVSDIEL